jgi:hypothetical protein
MAKKLRSALSPKKDGKAVKTDELSVTWVEIGDVKPYERNPRVISKRAVEAVAESIRRFGWRQPIVVDKDYVIIVGHVRYEAAKQLGLKRIPVHVATTLTPQQVAAYRIADNKTNELTRWDSDLLGQELADLLALPDVQFDWVTLGFSQTELDKLFLDIDNAEDREARYVNIAKSIFYQPRMSEPPKIEELFDDSEAAPLLEKAKEVPEPLRTLLTYAAVRFVRFRFDKIAEFYCHADDQTKRLFEDMCLVIVDYDKAIEKGWLQLIKGLGELIYKSVVEGDENAKEAARSEEEDGEDGEIDDADAE